jgi:hypothetical protein
MACSAAPLGLFEKHHLGETDMAEISSLAEDFLLRFLSEKLSTVDLRSEIASFLPTSPTNEIG